VGIIPEIDVTLLVLFSACARVVRSLATPNIIDTDCIPNNSKQLVYITGPDESYRVSVCM
jgi:hypothetical protein